MSRHERWEQRERVYSNWHRYACSDDSNMVDIDGLEYCGTKGCGQPLLLIESARDVGQLWKPTTAMNGLARKANIPAVVLLWTPSATFRELPPHCLCMELQRPVPGCDHGVAKFRCRHVSPALTPWIENVTGAAISEWIANVHHGHTQQMHLRVA